ncbi:tyrosine-type recombinase/integrase [Komagataeibacter diospyri]|uniref:tyrosine-type recombinase/integrase n=1 Tax=Komagataeibacter diospyri TaxID=1932662 RepID=UPI003756D650
MKHLSDVRLGSDPGAQRDHLRSAATMKEFGKRFLDEHVASHCKPSTQYEYGRCVDLFITPKLGTLKIIDVTRADVVELHQGLKETPYQANRVLGVLSIMFTLADTWGVRTDGINPCWKVKRYKEVKRERYLTPDELARLGKVLREADGEPEAATCIRLLLLTGCRLGEIQMLKWKFVDARTGVLRLPDSKTGAKIVPVGKAALDVLAGIPRIDGNPYVITGKVDGQYLTDIQKPWRRLRARAGLDTLRIHDLRHSFASDALQLGADLTMIGRLLGHTQVQTTARYTHLKTDPIRETANAVASAISFSLEKGI